MKIKIKIEEAHTFEAFSTEGSLAFKAGAKLLGLDVETDEAFIVIPPQDLDLEPEELEKLLNYLDDDGVDHTLSMVTLGKWYLDLF